MFGGSVDVGREMPREALPLEEMEGEGSGREGTSQVSSPVLVLW